MKCFFSESMCLIETKLEPIEFSYHSHLIYQFPNLIVDEIKSFLATNQLLYT